MKLLQSLLVMLVAGAYLYPLHLPPWTTFFNDGAWALALVVMAALLLWRGGLSAKSDRYVLSGIVALLLLTLGLMLAGLGDETAWFGFIYLALSVLAWVVGTSARVHQDVMRVVLVGLFLAALLSAVLAIMQWLGVFASGEWSSGFIMEADAGGRVHSNIGQANNLGTLLLLGMWSLLVLSVEWRDTRTGRLLLAVVLAILSLGVYFSGSRTALLNLFLAPIFMVGWCLWRRQRIDPWMFWPLAMVLLLMWVVPWLSAALGAPATPEARAFSDPVRLRLWQLAWDGITSSPWTGHGLEALGRIYLHWVPVHGSFNETIPMHAHNTVLDLWLAWGLPVGTLVALFVLGWWGRALLRLQQRDELALWLMPTAMLLHAMLEYPLHYGFFLWPFFLLLGVLNAPRAPAPLQVSPVDCPPVAGGTRAHWRQALAGTWLLVGLGAMFFVWKAYVETEALYTQVRNRGLTLDEMHARTHPWSQTMFPRLLNRLEWTIRPVDGRLSAAELDSLTQTATHKPYPQLMWKVAVVHAQQGRPEQASWWLSRACTMYPSQCKPLQQAWLSMSARATGSPWPAMPWSVWLEPRER